MNSNYSIISEKDKVFYVKEESTNQIINKYSSRKDANKFIKRVKSGAVFCGWSPFFMFNKDFERVYKKLFQGEKK